MTLSPAAATVPTSRPPRQRGDRVALRALNRFGFGARVGEPGTLDDPLEWLLGQLKPEHAELAAGETPSLDEITGAIGKAREARRTQDQDSQRMAIGAMRDIMMTESQLVLRQRVRTETPFVERLVAFWSNHLCVSVAAKVQVVALAGLYERQAIRPHVLGRFSDLVLASARHPAMLLYLDNAQSSGPDSQIASRTARSETPRGLNENYARELLELHTVGVDGGYTQEDVEQLALALTGWTVGGIGPSRVGRGGGGRGGRGRGGMSRAGFGQEPDEPGFVFRPFMHQPGTKSVLGKRYRENGEREGEAVIRDLCSRDATAHFVATKLVGHFVSDDPPPAAVSQIAKTFKASGGDLLKVSRELVQLEAAWEPANRKFRTPQDWIVAVLRAARVPDVQERVAGGALRQLRHAVWAPPAPKGYGDGADDWADPASLMNRAELGRSLSRVLQTRRLAPESLLEVVEVQEGDPLPEILRDGSIPADERIALAIGGPAFQWR